MAKNRYAGMNKLERYRHHTQSKLVRMTTAEIMKLSPLAYAMDECGTGKAQWLLDCVADCVRNEKKIRAEQLREEAIKFDDDDDDDGDADWPSERQNVTFEEWLEMEGDNWVDEDYDHDKMVERWGDFLKGSDYQI